MPADSWSRRRPRTDCRAASPTSTRSAKRSIMRREGVRGLNFHDPRGVAGPRLSLSRAARGRARRRLSADRRAASSRRTGSRWSPRPAPNSPRCSSARSMPAPGRCRCRCRPRSAAAIPISTSSRSSSTAPTRAMLFYPGRARRDGRRGGRGGGRRRASTGRASPTRDAPEAELPEAEPDDIAYLQYSSGSTRFPHGVAVTHRALLNNLAAHSHGMEVVETDRCISWLPWYHDMGLVGCLLSPIANQVSTDYLKTEDFARRPLAWLDLISRNEGTTLSYSPTFGYDICARRIVEPDQRRRALRPVALAGRRQRRRHDPARRHAGLRRRLRRRRLQAPRASCPSYGLAEATLAVTIMPPGEGIVVELVEETLLAGDGKTRPRPAAALPRDRQLRQAGARHGGRDPRRGRRHARPIARSARSIAAAPRS